MQSTNSNESYECMLATTPRLMPSSEHLGTIQIYNSSFIGRIPPHGITSSVSSRLYVDSDI